MSENNAPKGEVWIVTRLINDVVEYDMGQNPSGPWTPDPTKAFEYTDSLSGSAKVWAYGRVYKGLFDKSNALPTRRSPP